MFQKNAFEKQVLVQKKVLTQPELLTAFDPVLAGNTARLPQNVSVKWTHLSPVQIIEKMAEQLGAPVFFAHPYRSCERGTQLSSRLKKAMDKAGITEFDYIPLQCHSAASK